MKTIDFNGRKPTVIAADVVDQILDLLAEGGLSQRRIAQRVGVSRGTVSAIALGKRADRCARRPVPGRDFTPPSGLPARCPGCGGMVQMPCLLCHVRAIRQWQRLWDAEPMRSPRNAALLLDSGGARFSGSR